MGPLTGHLSGVGVLSFAGELRRRALRPASPPDTEVDLLNPTNTKAIILNLICRRLVRCAT